MSAKSFKQMVADKEIKRADAYKVRLQDIHEEPGFNLRLEGEELDESIAALAAFIGEGGNIPPLEVRPRPAGGVWLVDGHRRTRALRLALENGVPLQDQKTGEVWIEVKQFEGNDAERVARILTSAEKRSLQPIETAEGYRRLRSFGWTNEQIGKKVGKTGTHVAQLLMLAGANTDVQKLVQTGVTSASIAVKAVREHGEKAGAVLAEQHEKAKSIGKRKVTAGTITGKRAPPAMWNALLAACGNDLTALPESVRVAVMAIQQWQMKQTAIPDSIGPEKSAA